MTCVAPALTVCLPWCQVPSGLPSTLAQIFHVIETSVRAYLVGLGMAAASVPFEYQKTKMTLLKGEAALAARRHVASKFNDDTLRQLRVTRRVDKPNWSLMQQLHDADFKHDPISGMPVYDPSKCSPKLLSALWRAYCGVAETINTKELGQTDEALEELKARLLEHAARITENAPPSKQLCQVAPGASAKRPRSSPASALSDEGTDTGEPGSRQQQKRQRMFDESMDEAA